jgi:MHS family proline/betaine transporter-like MFS transporter
MQHPSFSIILAGQLVLAASVGLYTGAEPAACAEAFSNRVRCSGTAISHNLCMTILGGTAPMVTTWLVAHTHDSMSPPLYLMAAAAVTIIASLTLRETAWQPLA